MNFTSTLCDYIKYKETLMNFKVYKKKLKGDRGKGSTKVPEHSPAWWAGLMGGDKAASVLGPCSHQERGVTPARANVCRLLYNKGRSFFEIFFCET